MTLDEFRALVSRGTALLFNANKKAQRAVERRQARNRSVQRPIQELAVTQKGTNMEYGLKLRDKVQLKALWIRSPKYVAKLPATIEQPQLNQANIVLSLDELSDIVRDVHDAQLQQIEELSEESTLSEPAGLRGQLYLEYVPSGANYLEGSESLYEPDQLDETLQVFVPLGAAASTHMLATRQVSIPGGSVMPYNNRRGVQALAINRPAPKFMRVRNDSLSVVDGHLQFTGRIYTRGWRPETAQIVLLGRTSGFRHEAPLTLSLAEEPTVKKGGLGRYQVGADVDFKAIIEDLPADNVDLFVEVRYPEFEEPVRARIGKSRYLVREATLGGHVRNNELGVLINPYYTFKAKNPSLRVEPLPRFVFDHLLKVMSRKPKRNKQGRPIWVVGELPYKAQDNGMHFFKYMRDHHPEIDTYYVLESDSPEARNLDGYDNVVDYRSTQHIDLILAADKLIGSHNPDFLYPTVAPAYTRKINAEKVFLQHGVTAAKWMVPTYGKGAPGFKTNLIMVCSEREKEFFVHDFGYSPSEVAVTGFARFDALFAGDVERNRKQLMVMPTWRPWLQNEDAFLASEYFLQWRRLLNSPELGELIEEHNLDVVFCLHPNMMQFSDYFDDLNVRLVRQGEVDVQRLMKESAMMVTDYSSVAFDFAFLERPVIYFQFDPDRVEPPHADPATEFPGPVVADYHEVLRYVDNRFSHNAEMESHFRDRAHRFLTHREGNTSERIFQAIRDAQVETGKVEAFQHTEFYQVAFRRFRRHAWYFPFMKTVFKAVRALTPADANTIVFESGQAKHFADSPRAIYDNLVARGDQRHKVWVYNGRQPISDPNTTVVKRHSPGFFWHLARAKYWVNNHNFPKYIHRRRNGVYLQTWHGTPLKRMFLDQENFHGRDPGYIDRVKEAVAQWNYLLSPSPYATRAMRSSYGYGGPVYELGYPRNDVLMSERAPQLRDSVRAQFGISPEKKVVLYAPTFRDDQPTSKGRFAFGWPFDPREFVESVGEDVVLLVRTHFLVSTKLRIPEDLRANIKDVSSYPDIQELFLASDQLVTDYSSSFFDYSLLKKPITFFAYDLENYEEELRGFYLNYETDLPGPIVRTAPELYATINAFNSGELSAEDTVGSFAEVYGPHDDGEASARVVDLLLDGIR